MSEKKIIAYRASYIRRYGIGYAATQLALRMNNEQLVSDIYSIQSDYMGESKHIKTVFPIWLYKLLAKLLKPTTVESLANARLIRLSHSYDIVYLWPGVSVDVFKALRKMNKVIVTEAVNCHEKYAKDILDAESKRIGNFRTHAITASTIQNEEQKLLLSDFVYCPSSEVSKSFTTVGIDSHKLIETSYGIDESELIDWNTLKSKSSTGFTAIFVGSVIPRKGIHLLLEYWTAANIQGVLKVIGKTEADTEELISRYTQNSTIEFISFTNDLASHYHSADLFILPSIEEGSPLVTYLALAAGLPCLVSPMGGGGVVDDGDNGYVLEPHNKDLWVEKLQLLAKDKPLREKMALSSRTHAENYIWSKVAQRRVAMLIERIEAKQ